MRIRRIDVLELCPDPPDTNLVFFRVAAEWGTAAEFSRQLKERGVLMNATSPTMIRAVTHLDVDSAAVDRAVEILAEVARR